MNKSTDEQINKNVSWQINKITKLTDKQINKKEKSDKQIIKETDK